MVFAVFNFISNLIGVYEAQKEFILNYWEKVVVSVVTGSLKYGYIWLILSQWKQRYLLLKSSRSLEVTVLDNSKILEELE